MLLGRLSLIMVMVAGLAATAAQAADDQDIAKNCEAQMLKAHPNKLPKTEATDKLRQDYYTTCINRSGKMNPFGEQQ
jgi:hypothetical protein